MSPKTTPPRSTRSLFLAPVLLCLSAAACQVPDSPAQDTPDSPEPWNWSEEEVRTAVNGVRAGRDLNPDSWPSGARYRHHKEQAPKPPMGRYGDPMRR